MDGNTFSYSWQSCVFGSHPFFINFGFLGPRDDVSELCQVRVTVNGLISIQICVIVGTLAYCFDSNL